MDSNEQTLLTQSERLFTLKQPFLTLWQETAENFYPERADFTVSRAFGTEFASHLTTSYPVTVSRDLADVFSTMLRPREKPWFKVMVDGYEDLSDASKDLLEYQTISMRNAQNDGISGFSRAMKEGDADMANFGNTPISLEPNYRDNAYLWRNWHLRDMAWCESYTGKIGRVDRKCSYSAMHLNQIFKGKIHQKVSDCLKKEPYKEFAVRHFVVPVDEYDTGKGYKNPYISIFYDVENKFVMEEVNMKYPYYVIPRWKTVSGSPYAYSPATVAGIADARMLQSMMLSITEAAEKAADPPMTAVTEALRSDINLFRGGITSVEAEYDERLGRVLRPVMDANNGVSIGFDLIQATKQALQDVFYLNKIGLPPLAGGMSPMEVVQRVQEYVMKGLSLFEPLEDESNRQICDQQFQFMRSIGAKGFRDQDFDGLDDLLGKDVKFVFENPLRAAADKVKGSQFLEIQSVIAQGVQFNPAIANMVDYETGIRDVIEGIGAPRKWIRSQDEMAAMAEQEAQKRQAQEIMAGLQQAAVTGQAIGDAGQSINAMQGGVSGG